MDVILEDTHQFVKVLCSVLRQALTWPGSRSGVADYLKDMLGVLEATRVEENRTYELYANDLARYRTQQLKDLDAVLERRWKYIPILRDFEAQNTTILDLLETETQLRRS